MQVEIAEARASARDARKKLVATQQRLELAVGRNMLQHGLNGGLYGVNGIVPASAPATPAQQLRPPRPGVCQAASIHGLALKACIAFPLATRYM